MSTNAHGILLLYIGMLLFQLLARAKLGRVRTEWRCIFGPPGRERAFVPDVVCASFEHLAPVDADQQPYLRAAPDCAVEILTPGESAGRFAAKLRFYLLHAGDTLDGGDVLPGFAAPAAEIIAQLREG